MERPVERKVEVQITFLCDAGLRETVCFKLGEPKLKWYRIQDGEVVYILYERPTIQRN